VRTSVQRPRAQTRLIDAGVAEWQGQRFYRYRSICADQQRSKTQSLRLAKLSPIIVAICTINT
jgi:hypothetical protein